MSPSPVQATITRATTLSQASARPHHRRVHASRAGIDYVLGYGKAALREARARRAPRTGGIA